MSAMPSPGTMSPPTSGATTRRDGRREKDRDGEELPPPRSRSAIVPQPPTPSPLPQHVTKREQKRGRAPDAVFDPQAHRDWVSGFGKRKKQRREEALRALAVRARRDRVEQRKEGRAKFLRDLGLSAADMAATAAESAAGAAAGATARGERGGAVGRGKPGSSTRALLTPAGGVATVTVEEVDGGGGSDDELRWGAYAGGGVGGGGEDDDDDDDDEGRAGSIRQRVDPTSDRARPVDRKELRRLARQASSGALRRLGVRGAKGGKSKSKGAVKAARKEKAVAAKNGRR